MKTGLLFVNGLVTEKSISKVSGQSYDYIIAADGGANSAAQYGFEPHYIIGDLDSIDDQLKTTIDQAQLILRPSQEKNDLEKALCYCNELNITHLTILGVCGKRFDHTLNNFSVLLKYDCKFEFTIFDEHSQIYIVRDQWKYSGPVGQTISLIPLAQVDGITTDGLGFPLKNESLALGMREGASNVIEQSPVRITIGSGVLLVFTVDN